MAHSLDIMPIRIKDEGTIVIGMVLRAKTRRAMVRAARRQRRRMKPIYSGAVRRREGDVHTGQRCAPQPEPEERLLPIAIAREGLALPAHKGDAERRQRCIIESPRPREIRDADGHVVEHRHSPFKSATELQGHRVTEISRAQLWLQRSFASFFKKKRCSFLKKRTKKLSSGCLAQEPVRNFVCGA